MDNTLRQSMGLLHTWAGVIIGSVLFAIFWMGTLSVFDREIDRWMMPGTRLQAPAEPVSLDRTVLPAVALVAAQQPKGLADVAQWGVNLPTERAPQMRFFYRDGKGEFISRAIDPNTGRLIADQGTLGGTGFIFPFHFRLHIKWLDIGYWLVGLAAMAMLVLVISGVIIHRKIFVEFFTFRPRKHTQRASLDLHNLTGVLGLPFHFVIALSGLVIFMGIYFPQAHVGAYGAGKEARQSYNAETFGRYTRPKANAPGAQQASLDAMVAQAEAQWAGGKAFFVRVFHPGDANSFVEVRRSYAQDVTMNLDQVYFDAQTGAVLSRFEAAPVVTAQRFISGLHFIQFDHWLLRWLYFLAGLSGCVMIASGFVFWMESRRASHIKKNLAGVRVVEALTIGSVSGIVIATLAFFIANRVLPLGAEFAGFQRAELEMWVFYLVWLATFGHAAWRRADPAAEFARRGWREQCWAIAALAVLAAALNAATTGHHLGYTLTSGSRAVAGMDLMLLLTAGVAIVVAQRLGGVGDSRSLPVTGVGRAAGDVPVVAARGAGVVAASGTAAGGDD